MPDQYAAAQEHQLTRELLAPRDELPDDPTAAVDNPQFQVVRRGYEKSEVDAYVRRVTGIVRDLVAIRSPREAIRQALERVGEETSDILRRAHETADEIAGTSRREAEERVDTARQEAARMIADAEARVAELDRDADTVWQERERILGDVDRLSAELQTVRSEADHRFPPDPGTDPDARALPVGEAMPDPSFEPGVTSAPADADADAEDLDETVSFSPEEVAEAEYRPFDDEPLHGEPLNGDPLTGDPLDDDPR
jgi:DivIVA domain-containing protein